jgi:hypothetical protein
MAGKRAGAKSTFGIEFTELRNGALNDTPAHAHVLDQSPVAMRLAVLLARARSQKHRVPSQPMPRPKKRGKVGTTPLKPAPTARKCLNALTTRAKKWANSGANCAT